MEEASKSPGQVLGENVSALAASQPLGDVALAKAIGIGTGSIRRAKRGETVETGTLFAIAAYFKVNVPALLTPGLGRARMAFADLDAFESQLVGLFRRLPADQRQHLLLKVNTAVNSLEASPVPSPANPFPSAVRLNPDITPDPFGDSDLGTFDPRPMREGLIKSPAPTTTKRGHR